MQLLYQKNDVFVVAYATNLHYNNIKWSDNMDGLTIFKNINLMEIECMLKCFEARKIVFKKERTIVSNVMNTKMIGVILSGSANMIRYDYNGNRTIIEKLEEDSVFGEVFSYLGSDISVVATSDCEVLFIDYNHLVNRCKKNCPHHAKLTDNVLQLLSKKIIDLNGRLEVLSKRSIRDKLLSYFDLLIKRKGTRTFTLPFNYTELADYLSVDRSAMMREIKNLKDEGFITTNGRKISLNY